MEFEFPLGRSQPKPTRSADTDIPLRILVPGNFSGGGPPRDAQPRLPLALRPLVRIDINRFDEVLGKIVKLQSGRIKKRVEGR